MVVALLSATFIQWMKRKQQTKGGETEESHVYEEIPEDLTIRPDIELQQNNAYGHTSKNST